MRLSQLKCVWFLDNTRMQTLALSPCVDKDIVDFSKEISISAALLISLLGLKIFEDLKLVE